MGNKVIVKCRICGKLMSRYPFMVYEGDETCCSECNRKAERTEVEARTPHRIISSNGRDL